MLQEGGCQCGHVRYRLNGPPLTLCACHCRDCQKQSASAFGMSLWVRQPCFAEEPEDPEDEELMRLWQAHHGSA